MLLLLKDHILDKKILDLEDTEVEVVYDLQLVLRNEKMYVTAVDSSRYGRWRRLGFRRTADQTAGCGPDAREHDPLDYRPAAPPEHDQRSKARSSSRYLRKSWRRCSLRTSPTCWRNWISDQRVMVFNQLETEHASDTLEEIDPNVQRELVSSLHKDRVAELINQMTSGQAADLLSALPHDEAETLMSKIQQDLAAKVRSIMEKAWRRRRSITPPLDSSKCPRT